MPPPEATVGNNIFLLSQPLWLTWSLDKIVIMGDVPQVDLDLFPYLQALGGQFNGIAQKDTEGNEVLRLVFETFFD